MSAQRAETEDCMVGEDEGAEEILAMEEVAREEMAATDMFG